MLVLKVVKGPAKVGHTLQLGLNKTFTLGRSSESDFQLPSNGISKKHCQVQEIPGAKIEILDLGSSNGTYINGVMIKKYVAKPGDTISLHDFVIRVELQAPSLQAANTSLGGFSSAHQDLAQNLESQPSIQSNNETKQQSFIAKTINPIADNIAKQADVRFLVLGFFIIWSIAVSALSIFPFSDTSNTRIKSQAAEVSKLYARQLARINQPFIIEHTYQKLIHTLDQFQGQTPGILSSMIVDASNGLILSPPDLVGRAIASPDSVSGLEIIKKLQDPNGFSKIDSRGVIHAMAPIRVGVTDPTSGGVVSKVAAVAYVEMDATRSNLQAADLVDGALTAVLTAIVFGFLFIIFVYRWTEGSLVELSDSIEKIISGQSPSVNTTSQWPTVSKIVEQINTVASRTNSSSIGNEEKTLEWAMATVESLPVAAAAFDTSLIVVSWNNRMENLIGIRTSMALGNDISAASRDVAFEGAIRDLSTQAISEPGVPQRKNLDFSGREHEIVLVYSEGAHLVTIVPNGEG